MIKDTTGPGRTRRLLTAAFLVLAALLVMTLMVPRFTGLEESAWFAWPGYIWFALVGYLLLALLVLEPVRLALRSGLNRLAPMSSRSPAKAAAAGLLAPAKPSCASAVAAPAMPLAFVP